MNREIIRTFLIVLCAVYPFIGTHAQVWNPLNRGFNNAVLCLFSDTISNRLYAGGSFSKTGFWTDTNGKLVMGIAQWNGISWDSLGCGMDNPSCLPTSNTPNN